MLKKLAKALYVIPWHLFSGILQISCLTCQLVACYCDSSV